MKIITIVSLVILIASCNSPEKETDLSGAKDSPVTTCYRYANEADTVTLKLIRVGDSVTGDLIYALKEKDKNTGTIKGVMKKNLLVADYLFVSEGMLSTRQVAFKWEGNTLAEGYGDSFMKNEKVYFKNIDSLKFNNSIKLAEIGCQ